MEFSPAAKDDHEAAASFLTLPESVVANILKRLSQHNRLSRAALVCKTWAAAAAAATTVITLTRVNAATAAGLSRWLQQHSGGAVEAISVPQTADDHLHAHMHAQVPVQLKLPAAALTKLKLLHLDKCALEFSTSGSSSGVQLWPRPLLLALSSSLQKYNTRSSSSGAQGSSIDGQDTPSIALPALRCIQLQSCRKPLGIISQMDCPKLTALHLTFSDRSHAPPADSQQLPDAALSALLQRLPELMSLTLANNAITDAGLAQISCLQKLQHCALACEQVTPTVLTNLTSTSLTSLTLISGEGVLQERDLPAAGWPHLKLFRVNDHAMQPAVVARLTALEQLHLDRCDLVANPNTAYDVRVKEGAVQLLAALAPLANLKRLDLTDILLEPLTLPPDGLQSTTILPWKRSVTLHKQNPFSSLTASSVLESLTLAYRSPGEGDDPVQPLPQGAVAALFPPDRKLTALTELVLDGMDPELVAVLADDEEVNDLETDPYNIPTCVRDCELPMLLEACPGLQRLTLNSVLQRWCAELYPLFCGAKDGLPQLTYLCLGGLCMMDDDAPALARMTRLRELELHNAPELGPDGLAHLTELRQLSRLLLHGIGHRRCLDVLLVSTSKTGPPNVWQQLQLTLPGLREQQWAMQQGYDSEDDPYDDSDYTDSSDSDGCVGRRRAMCAGYW